MEGLAVFSIGVITVLTIAVMFFAVSKLSEE